MEQNQQNNVLLSADEKAPALRPCFEAISGELSAINTTIRRMVVLDIDDRWDDVPEDTKLKQTCKQPADSEDSDHEEIDFEDSGCAWLLETAIFTGYSGYNGPSASSSTHNAQETKPLAEPRPNKRSTGASRQRPCRKLYHEAKQVGSLSCFHKVYPSHDWLRLLMVLVASQTKEHRWYRWFKLLDFVLAMLADLRAGNMAPVPLGKLGAWGESQSAYRLDEFQAVEGKCSNCKCFQNSKFGVTNSGVAEGNKTFAHSF